MIASREGREEYMTPSILERNAANQEVMTPPPVAPAAQVAPVSPAAPSANYSSGIISYHIISYHIISYHIISSA